MNKYLLKTAILVFGVLLAVSYLVTPALAGNDNIVLTGAVVRDHRSNSSGPGVTDHRSDTWNSGTYYQGGGHRGGGGRRNIIPPVSKGNGEGGVTVTPSGNSRGIPCLGNLC